MKNVVIAIFLFLVFCNINANAQYRLEIGGLLGGSSYQGDAIPNSPFADLTLYYSGMLRYNFNERYSLKLNIGKGSLSGDTQSSGTVLPGDNGKTDYSFSKDISEVSVHLEYNFFPYTAIDVVNASRFSPYIFAGFGTTLDNNKSSIHLPFGLGIKYRLLERLNIGFEAGYRKMFTDDLDHTDEDNKSLDNPLQLNESNWINNDWYMVGGFFITYSFGSSDWNCTMEY